MVKVLLIEDDENDELLIARQLRKWNPEVQMQRFWKPDELKAALTETWDIVLSDYRLPGFRECEALEIFQASGQAIPFVVVTGAVGEERAVELLKRGASDFLLKGSLERLPAVIEHALRENATRLAKLQAEAALRQAYEEMEQRVRERTAELSARNEALRTTNEALTQALASLAQAEKMAALGGLVAGIAHEINTPVGIVVTSASVLKEQSDAVVAQFDSGALHRAEAASYLHTAQECAELIIANAQRAARLIQSFKQVAADQTSEARRVFDLKTYLDEIVVSLYPKFKHSQVTVTQACPENIAVDGYPGSLAQILTNLLINALTHAFDADALGAIRIEARDLGDRMELQVSDNGKGIAVEHLAQVFEPFFTTRRAQGNTGLGLSIVHNLVTQRLKGTIEVSSAAGQGARFTIVFPKSAPETSEW